jgi:type I restriction enzyme R subunit
MLSEALNRYQNRTIDAAQVIAEIVEIAKAIRKQRQRGEETGLTENELAFYDALATNESARLAMQDETLRKIAHELTEIVGNDAKTDWQVRRPSAPSSAPGSSAFCSSTGTRRIRGRRRRI